MASSIDDNAADGNLDQRNVRLISVGYTRQGVINDLHRIVLLETQKYIIDTD